jgi:hypothetical protein
MWVSKKTSWTSDLTPLERFVTERIIQRCEADESISNKHRTSNGYTQLKEILSLSILSLQRTRTVRTVKALLEEAKSPWFSQNIVNDIIIAKYFSDLKKYITGFDSKELSNGDDQLNLSKLNLFIHALKVFESQLDKRYFKCLSNEFLVLNYKDSEQFHRKTKAASDLVDLLVPYLVFKGYATSALSEVLISWIEKGYKGTVRRMFAFFNFQKRTYEYVIKVDAKAKDEFDAFIPILEEELCVNVDSGTKQSLKKYAPHLSSFDSKQKLIIYHHEDLDPHIHIRSFYDGLLKKLVQKRERQSLAFFNNFFDSCYWRIPRKNKEYHFIKLVNDPINVNSRGRTLREVLLKLSFDEDYSFDEKSNIPIPENAQLSQSLYYYNLALGSKSIENSLSLLWTSLESLLPFRSYSSDIVCVQSFVSKSLALGGISRDILAFADRVKYTSEQNDNPFTSINMPPSTFKSIKGTITSWYNWLVNPVDHDVKFDLIKGQSELLAFEYYRIAKPLTDGKLKSLQARIFRSEESMKFQLQRIYLHRNQIIHSGNLVNEYTNLWMHLEWYIGKLLAFAIIQIEIKKNYSSLSDLFIEVHADHDYVISYLEKNKDKKMEELSPRIKEILLDYSWQAF